jgi:hypothetical protein
MTAPDCAGGWSGARLQPAIASTPRVMAIASRRIGQGFVRW